MPLPVTAGYQGGETDLPFDADYVKIFVWGEMSNLTPVTKSGEAR